MDKFAAYRAEILRCMNFQRNSKIHQLLWMTGSVKAFVSY